MAAITSIVAPVTAKATVAKRSSSCKPTPALKAASVFAKPASAFVSNGTEKKTSAMLVWTPVNNKFFETFSFLPPLDYNDINKQISYMTRKGFTPCIEFAMPECAFTTSHLAPAVNAGIDSRAFSGYYDNRYWTMWKLPMFGCTDPNQVSVEIDACISAFPGAYVRVCGFDRIRQVQMISFMAHYPVPPIISSERSV